MVYARRRETIDPHHGCIADCFNNALVFPAHLPLLRIVCDEKLRVDSCFETTQVQSVTLSGFACGPTPSGFQKRFIEQCSITSLRWRARYPLCVKNTQAAGACFWTPG